MSEDIRSVLKARIDYYELLLACLGARIQGKEAVEASRRAMGLKQRLGAAERGDHLAKLPMRRLPTLGLSPLETQTVALTVCAQIDRALMELAGECHKNKAAQYISPWIALNLFCETRKERLEHMQSFDTEAPLFRLGLLRRTPQDESKGNPLLFALTPAGFLSGFFRGDRVVGHELQGLARRYEPRLGLAEVALAPKDKRELQKMVEHLNRPASVPEEWHAPTHYDFPHGVGLLLVGSEGGGKSMVARALAHEAGRAVLELDGMRLATVPTEQAVRVLKAAFREANFFDEWLLLDNVDRLLAAVNTESPIPDRTSETAAQTLIHLIDQTAVTVIVTASGYEAIHASVFRRMALRYSLEPPSAQDLATLWRLNVPLDHPLAKGIDWRAVAEGHPLTGRGIQSALGIAFRSRFSPKASSTPDASMGQFAEYQSDTNINRMATRSWVKRSLDDLILAPELKTTLETIIATERIREAVLADWGLDATFKKGLGITCLFDGAPGTGKTLASEVIASELGLPLYVVSITHVVSKYIGETEKNLQKIFEDAAKGRCVILFDEADTLFSKRMEASSAVARYANMEVGLLLQLIESYRGLVLLTTNLKESIDPAFNRRFSHKLQFGFPNADMREQIWSHLLPHAWIEADVDANVLGVTYELSGGSIRNCVLRASYGAAAGGRKIAQADLERVARAELRGQGKLVRDDLPDLD